MDAHTLVILRNDGTRGKRAIYLCNGSEAKWNAAKDPGTDELLRSEILRLRLRMTAEKRPGTTTGQPFNYRSITIKRSFVSSTGCRLSVT